MKTKKILCILVCTLLTVVTSLGVAAKTFEMNLQNEPLINEPLPVEKVKEIPVPWQIWQFVENGVWDIVMFTPDPLGPNANRIVEIQRATTVLDEEIPLDDLTWEATEDLDWKIIDEEPIPINPDEQVEVFINMTPNDRAAIVRYQVTWEDGDLIESRFLNEVIIDWDVPQIEGVWINFDVHNDYEEPINNFELELYGNILPSDILDWYDPPGDPYKLGNVWYGGWGCPPKINRLKGGIEIIWIDKDNPVPYCEIIHFGIKVSTRSSLILTGANAYLTIWTKGKDCPANLEVIKTRVRESYTPFLKFLQNHPYIFPMLRRVLGL
jgi:hypothetical protein